MEFHPGYLVLMNAALAAVPFVIGIGTSYLKISIVLSIFRVGLGAQNVPSNVIVMILSLVLSALVMKPVLDATHEKLAEHSFEPQTLSVERIQHLANSGVLDPWRAFLVAHAGPRELAVIRELRTCMRSSETQECASPEVAGDGADSLIVLLPAFVLSELRAAFEMGLMFLLPLVLVDLVVSTVLIALGMFMVSPAMIALPVKLLLFTAADGWIVLSRSLVLSFGVS